MPLRPTFALAALAALSGSARADSPTAATPVHTAIDHYVDDAIKAAGVAPAPQADDATFVRRLTLDLVGRIPTPAEASAYVKAADADKRAKLVDRLLASPGFARHQAAQFEAMLNPEGGGRRSGALGEYLRTALAAGKSWERMYRELMLPDEADATMKGAADFLKSRVTDTDKLTNDVSVSFFGVNVSCAQCHDHPLVKDWTQDHFYGMKAFLVRTYDAGGSLAERGFGQVKYKANKGPEKLAPMMFLTGAKLDDATAREMTKDEQKKEKELIEQAKKDKKAPPRPAFSARAKLVEVSLKEGNADFFSRSVVNRMWHRYFGSGLVNPLDQMHSENPPSHPELLAWLAKDTASHGYDLKRLIRGIVMSQAYSRSSRYPTEATPDRKLFAVAQLKPFTPLQLSTSLKIAAADPAQFEGKKAGDLEKTLEQLESSGRGFASLIAVPTDNFQVGVGEALLFTNGDRVAKEFLTDNGVLARAKGLTDKKAAVALLVRSAYGREPTAAESTALVAYVENRADRLPEAYRQVLWALVTGPEFRFVY
ncbi:DUF1549 domain-containing protein [Urbifossiella limnaea]|uniref:DUF1549 domain-containing protein n=1 Tax=Urbifossiella limnaea TaxID=2528023 RepID=A0A517XUN0_9BACT|nr:DUF1549 domain-containing protein [Urbifossiella limnaea]QDU21210.1 hypothetical protein ETAA1_31750 [Urbifossiella limnaea]